MKIGIVCPYEMIDHAGGVAQVVVHLQEGLARNGHDVRIITPRPAKYVGDTPENFILLGNSANTKFSPGLATSGTWTFDIDNDEVKAVLDKEKFDVINFHEPWAPILARQILQLSDGRTAFVGTFHANLSDSMAAKYLVNLFVPYGRGIAQQLDLITAVSPAPAAVLLNKDPDGKLSGNIRYIPNGIDLKRYKTAPSSAVRHPNMKTILYVGRLEGRKGLKYLLKAYHELAIRCHDIQLFIAGKGPDEEKLRDYVRDNDIPRVTFLGFISDEDKVHHLHRADLFVAPAHRGESFGIVLLEAMAAGCPIVAGDNEGYQSVMKETGAISLVNPLDTIDFARRMEILLYDKPLRDLWLKWADKYVQDFEWKHIVRQYEDVYKEAVKIHAKQKKA
jgi:phosphatidylinositol alpha-mannosyltransferase